MNKKEIEELIRFVSKAGVSEVSLEQKDFKITINEIESDVKGRIVKVLVDNSTPIEYDQPLFLVDPS